MALTRITKGVIKPNENYDTHNINSTGIVTAVGANFTGNVSVGGTLTYEDVTSIDSVGIITARGGIKVGTGITIGPAGVGTFTSVHAIDSFACQKYPTTKISFPTNGDHLQIFTSNTQRMRFYAAGTIFIGEEAQGPSGNASLYLNTSSTSVFSDSSRLYDQPNKAMVHIKNYNATGGGEAGIVLHNDNGAAGVVAIYGKKRSNYTSDCIFRLRDGDSTSVESFRVRTTDIQVGTGVTIETNGQATFSGITTFASHAYFGNNVRAIFAANSRLQILSNGTNSYLDYAGSLNVRGSSGTAAALSFLSNSNVIVSNNLEISKDLDVDGHTNLDNVSIAGVSTITQDLDVDGHTNLDNVSVAGISTFGVSGISNPNQSDWATKSMINLYGSYGGGLSFNDNGNNGFQLLTTSSGVYFHIKNAAVGGTPKSSIRCVKDGSVELYHNGSKKIETYNNGVQLTGNVYIPDGSNSGSYLGLGNAADFRIYHDGSLNVIDATAHNLEIRHGSAKMIVAVPDGAVELYHNNQKKIETFATGANVIGNLDVINGHVYINDNYKAYFGTGNDLFIEHDGNNSVFRNTTGDLYIQNNGSGTMFIQPVNNVGSITAVANGRVELAFAGNKKFETTSTGATITGTLTASHTGTNQIVVKDSDTSGDAAHMRISFQDSGGTEKFFVGNDNSNGWLYLGSPSGQNNNIAFRVNGSDKFQVNYSGAYVNGALTVNGNVDILDSIIHTGDTNTKIRFPTNDQISFETNGSEQMKVAGTNITLGTNATTGHVLQIKNRGNDCNNTVALGLDIQAAWMRIGDALSGGQTYGNGLGIKFHDSGVVHWSIGKIGSSFYISNTSNSGTQLFPSSRTDALFFNSTGNATFHNNVTVGGNLSVTGTTALSSTVAIPDSIVHDGDADTKIRFPSADQISFETGGSERGRFDNDGNFLVGTTGHGNAGAGARKLVISGPSNIGLTINSTTTSGIYRDCNIYFGYGTSTNDMAKGQLTYSGNGDFFHMSVGNTAYTLAKSFRLSSDGTVRFDSTPTAVNSMSLVIKSHKARAVNDNNGIVFRDANDHTQAVINVQKKSTSDATSDLVFRTSSGQVVNTLQGIPERLRITGAGNIGLNVSTPQLTKGIQISKAGAGQAPNTYSLANEYMHFGYSEYNPNGDKGLFVLGFGYVNGATNSPAYMGFRETNTGSYTYGDLVFATRGSYNNAAPTERLRIHSDGSITQNYANPQASSTFRISKSGAGVAELRFDTATANTASLMLGTDEELIVRYGATEKVRFLQHQGVKMKTNAGSGIGYQSRTQIYPYWTSDTGACRFNITMVPSTAASTPRFWIFTNAVTNQSGTVTIGMNGRTNSPSNAQWRYHQSMWQVAMYGEGDNEGGGMRYNDSFGTQKGNATISSGGNYYVHYGHSEYNTNANQYQNLYGGWYWHVDTGASIQAHSFNFDCFFTFGGDPSSYTWYAYVDD